MEEWVQGSSRLFELNIMRQRSVYFLTAVVVMFLGLASRRYREYLPQFVGQYSGDTLWALMLFLFISVLLARHSIVIRGAISIVVALLVEISQLYHPPWIDSIRQTPLGGLVLGFGFLWSDLICYAVGVGFGVIFEVVSIKLRVLWVRDTNMTGTSS